MFERILVPLDGSEPAARALPVAREIAARFHGRIVLVAVVARLEDWHRCFNEMTDAPRSVDLEKQALQAARLHLGRVAAGLHGVPVDIDVRTGRPADAIHQAAQEHECTLICMAAHGQGHAEHLQGPVAACERALPVEWMLGAISDRVVHTSPVAVLLVRPEQHSESAITASERSQRLH